MGEFSNQPKILRGPKGSGLLLTLAKEFCNWVVQEPKLSSTPLVRAVEKSTEDGLMTRPIHKILSLAWDKLPFAIHSHGVWDAYHGVNRCGNDRVRS
jgi:hypothetical protein